MSAGDAVDAAARRTAWVLVAAAVLAAGLWLVSGIATVEPGDRAVVLRWGAVDRVVGSGLVLAWPRPCEEIIRIPGPERTRTSEIRRLAMPAAVHPAPDAAPQPPARTAGCLTGDAGLVHLEAAVVWTVEDPAAFVTATRGGEETLEHGLERAFIASAIGACAVRSVDGVLVVGSEAADEIAAQSRERLRGDLALALNARLAELGLGIRAQRIDITAELPARAKPAFAEVLSAAQAAERAVADARADAERMRQDALAFRAQRLGQAEALAKELTSRARVATDAIVALAQERDPGRQNLLRQRVWRERLEGILRKAGSVTALDRGRPVQLWLEGRRP